MNRKNGNSKDIFVWILQAVFFVVVGACGDGGNGDNDDNSSDNGDSSGDSESSEGDGTDEDSDSEDSDSEEALVISAGDPLLLDVFEYEAQNTFDIENKSQISWGENSLLRMGDCGDTGLIFWKKTESGTSLMFADLSDEEKAVETISEDVDKSDAVLFYDSNCVPFVIFITDNTELKESARSDDGAWTQSSEVQSLDSLLGETPSSLSIADADVGADKGFYIFIQASVGGDSVSVRGKRDAEAGSNWSFETLPALDASELYAYRVDAKGATRALYRNTQYPCDPCNVDLLHATLADGGEAWTEETVQTGVWGDPNDEFVEAADIDFDSAGAAHIAAHFIERLITGSYVATALRVYSEVDGEWRSETVVSENDDYEGSDGAVFTGADPKLAIDNADRLHIAFGDQSLWHEDGMQNEIRGQVRYAARSGKTWTTKTLFSQKGQTLSANPLIGFSAPFLAVSPDGAEVFTAGVQFSWETSSIYNNDDMPVTSTLTAVGATVSAP